MEGSKTRGRVIECRAAVAWEPRKDMSVEIIKVDPPKRGEVRVKMAAVGICFSDLAHWEGDAGIAVFPVVLGHEGCGTVESIGDGVVGFKEGDVVIPLWKPECGRCQLCNRTDTNLCEKVDVMMNGYQVDGTVRMWSKDGKAITQLCGVGCFSEYCVMPDFCVVKVSSSAPLVKLPPFGCCFPTGYGAAINTAGVKPGSTAVVFGLGSVGLCAVLGCRDAGAARIIGVDTNPDKFAVGKVFGCTDVVNPNDHKEPVQKVLKQMTNDQVDFTIVAVGSPSALESAVSASRQGYGKNVLIGIVHDKDAKLQVNNWDLLLGKNLTGTWCGGCKCLRDIPAYVDSYQRGKFKEVDMLTTGIIPLEKINEGCKLLYQGKALRTVIQF